MSTIGCAFLILIGIVLFSPLVKLIWGLIFTSLMVVVVVLIILGSLISEYLNKKDKNDNTRNR
jgi:nitrogen fixation/metabolism regulation signal transduction histidine kinase